MARFYVFIGQSNSRGAAPNADCHPSLSSAMTSVKMWNGSAFANFDVGVNQNYPTSDLFHGALPAFLYNEQIRTGQTIYAMNYAIGGTKLNDDTTSNCWYPSRAGALCDKAIGVMNAALADMWITHSIRSFDVYFIWAQGESDTTLSADSTAYETNLTNLIAKFESNISGTALATSAKCWILQKISTGTDYDVTRMGQVNTAMSNIAAAYPSIRKTYDPTGKLLQADVHHYEASGYKGIGEEMVSNIMTTF
jgi:Carbohydrate esterase, sialic acid-specific acetylesterase